MAPEFARHQELGAASELYPLLQVGSVLKKELNRNKNKRIKKAAAQAAVDAAGFTWETPDVSPAAVAAAVRSGVALGAVATAAVLKPCNGGLLLAARGDIDLGRALD